MVLRMAGLYSWLWSAAAQACLATISCAETARMAVSTQKVARTPESLLDEAKLRANCPHCPLRMPSGVPSHIFAVQVEYIKGSGDQPGGDVFFFDYGVVRTLSATQGSCILSWSALPIKSVGWPPSRCVAIARCARACKHISMDADTCSMLACSTHDKHGRLSWVTLCIALLGHISLRFFIHAPAGVCTGLPMTSVHLLPLLCAHNARGLQQPVQCLQYPQPLCCQRC